jgi:hypothetical protein
LSKHTYNNCHVMILESWSKLHITDLVLAHVFHFYVIWVVTSLTQNNCFSHTKPRKVMVNKTANMTSTYFCVYSFYMCVFCVKTCALDNLLLFALHVYFCSVYSMTNDNSGRLH